jgi:hypothetical protein
MQDYGEHNKINFKQFIFLLAKFRRGKIKTTPTEFNTRDSKLRFLFDVRKVLLSNKNRRNSSLDVRSKS